MDIVKAFTTNNLHTEKIKYYLKHDKEREEISRNGMNFVREHHSNEVRIKEMTEIIEREL